MYLVRELITKAYKESTVRGLGETPDSDEVADALESLNGILDELTARPEFSPAKKFADIKVDESRFIVISDDPSRIVSTAIADTYSIVCTCVGPHGLKDSEVGATEIVLKFGGVEYTQRLKSIVDMNTFSVAPNVALYGTYSGCYRKSSEGMEYSIDIIDTPPVNVFQVVKGRKVMPELQEQDFYSSMDKYREWFFYDKSRNPYPKVWVGESGVYRVVYEEPCWHDLKIDTDLEPMPKVAREVIKWKLASDLAASNGYLEVSARCEQRYKTNLMTFFRSQWNSASPLSDISAPGFSHNRYNIREDE